MPGIAGHDVARLLEERGFDFFTGVPCSLIEALLAELEHHPRLPYVAAVREDVAVGLAAGAWLGGRRPAVLMQNSGLGTSLNAIASLSLLYGLPALLLVTWRGYGGRDAPEHLLMGEISPRLFDLLGVPYRVPSASTLDADLAWAAGEMNQHLCPVALLLPPGVVETHARTPPAEPAGGLETWGAPTLRLTGATLALDPPAPPTTPSPEAPGRDRPLVPTISRHEALAVVVKQLGTEPVVHANGYICRESFAIADRPENFYMIGSMGLAPAIALGLTLAMPARPVVVFDGDGNLLMNLGILPMVGSLRPPRLVHCVFDNEVYGSTGNQASIARDVRLDRLALAAGYRTSLAVTERGEIEEAIRAALATDGPHFLLAKVTREEADVPRIPHTPAAIRDRFRAALGTAPGR